MLLHKSLWGTCGLLFLETGKRRAVYFYVVWKENSFTHKELSPFSVSPSHEGIKPCTVPGFLPSPTELPGLAKTPLFCSCLITLLFANAASVLQLLSQGYNHQHHAVASGCQATWEHLVQLPTYSRLVLVCFHCAHCPGSSFTLIMQLHEFLLQHRLQQKRPESISERQLSCLLSVLNTLVSI